VATWLAVADEEDEMKGFNSFTYVILIKGPLLEITGKLHTFSQKYCSI